MSEIRKRAQKQSSSHPQDKEEKKADRARDRKRQKKEKEDVAGDTRTPDWDTTPAKDVDTSTRTPRKERKKKNMKRQKEMKERGERQIEGQARQKHPPAKITSKTSIHLIDVDLGVIFGSMH